MFLSVMEIAVEDAIEKTIIISNRICKNKCRKINFVGLKNKKRCRIFENNKIVEKTNTKARLCEREWSTDRANWFVVV